MKKFLYNKACKTALKTFIRELEEYEERLTEKEEIHELNILNTGAIVDLNKLKKIVLERGIEYLKKSTKKL